MDGDGQSHCRSRVLIRPSRIVYGPDTAEPTRAKFHVFTFIYPRGTKSPLVEFRHWPVGRMAGCIMLSRHYFVSQVASLLKFAKETTNPQLAAVLIEKAADLKSQVDESSTTLDPSHVAPDVEPEK